MNSTGFQRVVIKTKEVPMDIDLVDDIFMQTQLQSQMNVTNGQFRSPQMTKKLIADPTLTKKRQKDDDPNRIYNSTAFLPDMSIPQNAHRIHTFEYRQIDRANLFEGLPYVQFDAYVRRDRGMQQLIVRDLLKIVADKCNSFKNLIMDRGKMKKVPDMFRNQIFCLMVPARRTKTNCKIEESIGLLNTISLIILLDFRDSPESIGLKPSPIKGYVPKEIKIQDEEQVFDKNLEVYNDMVQFFRDCIDAFMIMSRQMEQKTLDEMTCFSLMQCITKLRFNLSEMGEDLRVHDRCSDERVKRVKYLVPNSTSEKVLKNFFKSQEPILTRDTTKIIKEVKKTPTIVDQDESPQQKHILRQEKLTLLMQNKFNFSKGRFQTRESKIILNQDKIESEKALILESNHKSAKHLAHRVDNRKLLAMERLRDPSKDPEIRSALLIAARVLNINIEDQL